MTAESLLRHTRILASDDFEGRAPGTAGEEKTVSYLVDEFRRLGLKPGNPDGSFVQHVPLVGSTATVQASLFAGESHVDLAIPEQCIAWTRRAVPQVTVEDSEILFVGHGVVAPEQGWDDFKDVNVQRKTVLVLSNDPQVPDPADPARLNPARFKGRGMTYYGRPGYKFETAAAKGAAAVIIIHERELASASWEVIRDSNARENFSLQTPDGNAGRAAVEGWLHIEAARRLLGACGLDLEQLKKSAASADFRPVSLDAKASFSISNVLRTVQSRNVIARLEGSDPRSRREHVIYTAHWDHLGTDSKLQGDQVFNGAFDNATGTAALLEVAKAFSSLKLPPRRSVLFLATTAEEKGLLGAQYYAKHPLWPLEDAIGNLNIDMVNPWGRTRGIEIVGAGHSSLEETLIAAALRQGRSAQLGAGAGSGAYYRSDHFEFCRAGVPGLFFFSSDDFIGQPKEFALQKAKDYGARGYHKVGDEVQADWTFEGGLEDVALLFQVGWTLAQDKPRPEWKPESEFHRLRPSPAPQSRL